MPRFSLQDLLVATTLFSLGFGVLGLIISMGTDAEFITMLVVSGALIGAGVTGLFWRSWKWAWVGAIAQAEFVTCLFVLMWARFRH